ncbi:MAG: YbfB/YjiJ family MFS transporter [Acidiferrobacteraceae bacterium]
MTPPETSKGRVPLWVFFALAAGPAVALGFARFAYALILPAMMHRLGWSLTTAGAMNTANAVGYLAGALVAPWCTVRLGAARAFIAGLILTAVALFGTALADNQVVLALFRLMSGVAGGVTFVVGGGLVAQASAGASARRAALWLGIYFSGAGLGIIVSAGTVPFVLVSLPPAIAWRLAWALLGGGGLLTLVGVVPALRQLAHVTHTESRDARSRQAPELVRRLRGVLVAYGLYGAGYIVYMTFIVAFLQDQRVTPGGIVGFWTVLGSAAWASAFLWGGFLGRASGGRGVAGLIGLVVGGVLFPLWSTTPLAILGSAVLFGSAFLGVVTAVTTVARRNLPRPHWTPALAYLTVAFGLGQSIGPLLSGLVSNGPDGIRSGLALSAAILILGALAALTQRDGVPDSNTAGTSIRIEPSDARDSVRGDSS